MLGLKLQVVIQIVCSFFVIFTVNYSNGQLIGNFFKTAIENSRSNRFRLGDIINSAADTGRGLALNLDNAIPTPDEFFNFGKNFLVGYPVERAFTAINTICKYCCGWFVLQMNIFRHLVAKDIVSCK